MSRLLLALLCVVAYTDVSLGQYRYYRYVPRTNAYQRPTYAPGYAPATRFSRPTTAVRPTTNSLNSVRSNRTTNYRPTTSAQSAFAAANSKSRSRSRRLPYRLDSGDMLAVIVDGILEFKNAPMHTPSRTNGILAGMGHPVPVLEDGTIALPTVPLISVRGLTADQAQAKVANTFYDQNIIKRGKLVTVSLLRKRTLGVTVVHSKPNSTVRDISMVQLTPDENHVLAAVTKVGSFDTQATIKVLQNHAGRTGHQRSTTSGLQDGDVVDVNSPRTGFFYTGGLLPGGQHEIPRNRSLTIFQAISIAGGSVGGGRLASFPPSDVVVNRAGRSALTVDLNSAIQNRSSFRIQPGDVIMLRYKPGEIAGNLATSALLGPGIGLLLP